MKELKNYVSLILFAVLAISFASCSSDDDEGQGGADSNGFVEVEYEGAKTFSYYAYNATWYSGHQEVHGSVLDNLKNGATFIVDLSETKPSDVEVLYDEAYLEDRIEWQLETSDEIVQGAEITMSGSHWPEPEYDNAGWFCHDFDGKVVVKSIKNNSITLSFKDFKFQRISKFSVGNSTMQNLIVNGDITYNFEE
ncbi:MAG: hypothetical protein PUD39_06950 [Bacteroidales bacterium]|nr:hypothetical protein [Bacteroidales bacterium]